MRIRSQFVEHLNEEETSFTPAHFARKNDPMQSAGRRRRKIKIVYGTQLVAAVR
jgi:hypothetical protein